MFATFSYKWYKLDTSVSDMGINSIGAYKLSAIVSRILKKKDFNSKLFLCLCSSSV